MMTVEERYRTDPVFNRLVSMMVSQLEDYYFTPTELRQAAMLASIIFAQTRTELQMPYSEEIENAVSRFLKMEKP
jgi:hypothetical protein